MLHWQNDVKELRDSSEQPFAQTYLRTISNQLSAMFNHAVRHYGLQANPMRRTGKMGSKKSPVEMQFWTRDEYPQFQRQVTDKPISFLAFEVLYWTGIREGELLAPTPADFDVRRSTLSISKSYQRIKERDGVVTFCWTPVSLFFDYAMSPSSRLRLAMLVPNVSLIRSSRYQVMYPSSRSMNPLMVTPVKLRPWKNFCLGRPKKPSAAALSGPRPFAPVDRVSLFSLRMRIHSGHR